jgi:hypothetical protein
MLAICRYTAVLYTIYPCLLSVMLLLPVLASQRPTAYTENILLQSIFKHVPSGIAIDIISSHLPFDLGNRLF